MVSDTEIYDLVDRTRQVDVGCAGKVSDYLTFPEIELSMTICGIADR